MAIYKPNQPLVINEETFSDAVKRLVKEKGMTQAELVRRSCLSKTTISRICRDSNDKGGKYTPTEPIIMALSIGLKLSSAESKKQLLYAAFPERAYWDDFLDSHLNIFEVNIIMEENNFPLLGNMGE